jgi:hypothetical protein
MHSRRTDRWPGPDPHVLLIFLTDDWQGAMSVQVRYKGPGLHLTVTTNPSGGMILQGGDLTMVDREIQKAYSDLVQNRAKQ